MFAGLICYYSGFHHARWKWGKSLLTQSRLWYHFRKLCELSRKYQFNKTCFPEKGCSFASNNTVCSNCWLIELLSVFVLLSGIGGRMWLSRPSRSLWSGTQHQLSVCPPEPPNNCCKLWVTMWAAPSLGLLMVLLSARHLFCWFRKCWIQRLLLNTISRAFFGMKMVEHLLWFHEL